MSWRDSAAPIISRILRETAGKPEEHIQKALFEAYPFGIRQYHPYKIWLDEIKKQRSGKRAGVVHTLEDRLAELKRRGFSV